MLPLSIDRRYSRVQVGARHSPALDAGGVAHFVRLVLGLHVVPDEHLGRPHALVVGRRRRFAVRLVAVFLRGAEQGVVIAAGREGVRH